MMNLSPAIDPVPRGSAATALITSEIPLTTPVAVLADAFISSLQTDAFAGGSELSSSIGKCEISIPQAAR
jgi:hypothetical protein